MRRIRYFEARVTYWTPLDCEIGSNILKTPGLSVQVFDMVVVSRKGRPKRLFRFANLESVRYVVPPSNRSSGLYRAFRR
jgi:hypothetical protein